MAEVYSYILFLTTCCTVVWATCWTTLKEKVLNSDKHTDSLSQIHLLNKALYCYLLNPPGADENHRCLKLLLSVFWRSKSQGQFSCGWSHSPRPVPDFCLSDWFSSAASSITTVIGYYSLKWEIIWKYVWYRVLTAVFNFVFIKAF